MTIVAHAHPFVVGVEAHARNHALTVIAAEQFPAAPVGMALSLGPPGAPAGTWTLCGSSKDLVRQSRGAGPLEKTGNGPVTAAIALTVWSPGRVGDAESNYTASGFTVYGLYAIQGAALPPGPISEYSKRRR